jgi:uncharacterized membrane protein
MPNKEFPDLYKNKIIFIERIGHLILKYIYFILIFFTLKLNGQTNQKDTIQFGLYIKNISDLSPQTNSFSSDFYIWSNSNDSTSVFNQRVEDLA